MLSCWLPPGHAPQPTKDTWEWRSHVRWTVDCTHPRSLASEAVGLTQQTGICEPDQIDEDRTYPSVPLRSSCAPAVAVDGPAVSAPVSPPPQPVRVAARTAQA